MNEKLRHLFMEIVNEINRPSESVDAAGGEETETTNLPYGLDPETIELLLDDSISTGG